MAQMKIHPDNVKVKLTIKCAECGNVFFHTYRPTHLMCPILCMDCWCKRFTYFVY